MTTDFPRYATFMKQLGEVLELVTDDDRFLNDVLQEGQYWTNLETRNGTTFRLKIFSTPANSIFRVHFLMPANDKIGIGAICGSMLVDPFDGLIYDLSFTSH